MIRTHLEQLCRIWSVPSSRVLSFRSSIGSAIGKTSLIATSLLISHASVPFPRYAYDHARTSGAIEIMLQSQFSLPSIMPVPFTPLSCVFSHCLSPTTLPLLSYPLSLSCYRPSKFSSSPHAVETSCPLPFALRFLSCFVTHPRPQHQKMYMPARYPSRKSYTAILRSLLPSLFRLFLHPHNETLVHFTSLSGWSDVID